MNEQYKQCHWCRKYNHETLTKCSWCFQKLYTRKQRAFHILVFWSSIVGIMAAAYVAYQIGGI